MEAVISESLFEKQKSSFDVEQKLSFYSPI